MGITLQVYSENAFKEYLLNLLLHIRIFHSSNFTYRLSHFHKTYAFSAIMQLKETGAIAKFPHCL